MQDPKLFTVVVCLFLRLGLVVLDLMQIHLDRGLEGRRTRLDTWDTLFKPVLRFSAWLQMCLQSCSLLEVEPDVLDINFWLWSINHNSGPCCLCGVQNVLFKLRLQLDRAVVATATALQLLSCVDKFVGKGGLGLLVESELVFKLKWILFVGGVDDRLHKVVELAVSTFTAKCSHIQGWWQVFAKLELESDLIRSRFEDSIRDLENFLARLSNRVVAPVGVSLRVGGLAIANLVILHEVNVLTRIDFNC